MRIWDKTLPREIILLKKKKKCSRVFIVCPICVIFLKIYAYISWRVYENMNSGCLWGGELRDCAIKIGGEPFIVLLLGPFECSPMFLSYLFQKAIIL